MSEEKKTEKLTALEAEVEDLQYQLFKRKSLILKLYRHASDLHGGKRARELMVKDGFCFGCGAFDDDCSCEKCETCDQHEDDCTCPASADDEEEEGEA
jgi:hypothetical protein